MNHDEAQAFVDSLGIGFPLRIEDGDCSTATESFGLCYGGMALGQQTIRVSDWAKVTRQNLAHEVAHTAQAQFLGYPGHEAEHMDRWQGWLHLRESWNGCLALVYGPPTPYGCRVHEDMALAYAWIYGAATLPPTPGFFKDLGQIQECRDYFARTFKVSAVWLPSPNYWTGRALPIRYIVLHTTQGTDSRSWLTSPASGVSVHYLERDDDEYQLVFEADTAYHAGRIVGAPTTPLYQGHITGYDPLGHPIWSVNPNDESIGIEMEGFAAQPVSPTIIARTVARIREIRSRRGPLPLVNHSELSPGDRSDPGTQNRAAIDAALGEEDVMKEEDFARIDGMIVASEARILAAVKDYNPLVQVARRVVRSLRGTNPSARDPGTAYPDDTKPIT